MNSRPSNAAGRTGTADTTTNETSRSSWMPHIEITPPQIPLHQISIRCTLLFIPIGTLTSIMPLHHLNPDCSRIVLVLQAKAKETDLIKRGLAAAIHRTELRLIHAFADLLESMN